MEAVLGSSDSLKCKICTFKNKIMHLFIPNRRVPFLGQPAALPVLPGVVPDRAVRGSGGLPVPSGATAQPRRARGAGVVRAAAAAQVVGPERSAA